MLEALFLVYGLFVRNKKNVYQDFYRIAKKNKNNNKNAAIN